MIRILRSISGRVDGHNLEEVGTVDSLNPVIEEQLVKQGYAEYVAAPAAPAAPAQPPVETAEVEAAENTAARTSKPRPRKAVK